MSVALICELSHNTPGKLDSEILMESWFAEQSRTQMIALSSPWHSITWHTKWSTNQIASHVVARDDQEGHESVLIGYFSSCSPLHTGRRGWSLQMGGTPVSEERNEITTVILLPYSLPHTLHSPSHTSHSPPPHLTLPASPFHSPFHSPFPLPHILLPHTYILLILTPPHTHTPADWQYPLTLLLRRSIQLWLGPHCRAGNWLRFWHQLSGGQSQLIIDWN